MRKYAISLYLFLIGGILVGAAAFYQEKSVLSSTFLGLGYIADLAAIYYLIKVRFKS